MTDSIADELRRQWAERDHNKNVLLDSLDEHLPPPKNPSIVTRMPVIPKVEPVANVILFPVYSLVPGPVNLAAYRPDGK